MTKNYGAKVCVKCSQEYKPTGAAQKFCVACGKINAREYRLKQYHENNGREYSRLYKREHRDTFVNIEDYISVDDFRKMIIDTIVNRRGNMLSTKTTMRRILKRLGVYNGSWLEKRNRGGLAISFYELILDEFEKHGGKYFGSRNQSGDQYQFPLLKKVEK